ncbi:Peptidase family M1 [Mucilaginibacter mallensis]|uniref:Aminopeptidase N n=1 Tax=Mucilaginibacter mallensis TaxID=652787 RepID=A0A1H2C464_MUCMA|nr:Peptidase family M1 [Mucilaginibacter mallensis]
MFIATSVFAQTTFPGIDVQHYSFSIKLNDDNDTIKGQAAVTIKFLKNVSQVQLNLVKKNNTGKGMLVSSVTESGKNLSFAQDSDIVSIFSSAKINTTHTYTINYQGVPVDGLIISTNKFGKRTFFGDNWPNRAHNWLPCADYLSDKASLDFMVTAPDHYQVVSNGLKIEEKQLANHTKLTHWKETVPLPTKVMVIGVADFAIEQSGTVNGIPVYSYVFPENKEVGFKSYAYAPEILAYYIGKIGPYEFKKLANVQSKTIYGGMENSSAIFYDEKLIGLRYDEELMAHEIAHQWFGDAVTEKSWQNLWLSEGFATYMTNCYLEHKYGIDTLKKREMADRRKVIKFERERLTPVIDSAVKDNYVQLLNANSYEKGGWVLHMLRRKLGDTLFWKGIRAYYAKEEGVNANTTDLRLVMEQVSGQNLEPFFKQWLYTSGHPELSVNWKYDADKKAISIQITQKQDKLFEFPLTYVIGKETYTIYIRNKDTTITIAAHVKPKTIKMDPDVDLLAGFEVNEQN